ncbi:MAG: cupredoxin domain-containing protein [Flavobacteriaceae bacterium]|nr:cupredoxin domain-containing protein [Flavobacteriaceae bacterium]
MNTVRNHSVSLAIFVVGLACVFLVLTGFNNTDVNPNTPTKHVVTIYQMKFNPENISVKKGDIVEWVNKDFVPHDVTEINKKWTSKPLNEGDTFSKVVTKSFKYFCSIHLVMKGSVTVKD